MSAVTTAVTTTTTPAPTNNDLECLKVFVNGFLHDLNGTPGAPRTIPADGEIKGCVHTVCFVTNLTYARPVSYDGTPLTTEALNKAMHAAIRAEPIKAKPSPPTLINRVRSMSEKHGSAYIKVTRWNKANRTPEPAIVSIYQISLPKSILAFATEFVINATESIMSREAWALEDNTPQTAYDATTTFFDLTKMCAANVTAKKTPAKKRSATPKPNAPKKAPRKPPTLKINPPKAKRTLTNKFADIEAVCSDSESGDTEDLAIGANDAMSSDSESGF